MPPVLPLHPLHPEQRPPRRRIRAVQRAARRLRTGSCLPMRRVALANRPLLCMLPWRCHILVRMSACSTLIRASAPLTAIWKTVSVRCNAAIWSCPLRPAKCFAQSTPEQLRNTIRRMEQECDFLIIDNPGRDDPLARAAVELADTLVTPMNDSFVDFDLIGQVDPENFKVHKLSFFAELIWEARMRRSKATIEDKRPEMDWIVVRNRTGHTEARNMVRIEQALGEMAKRVGFRVAHGLSERVIYRELFPSGLTLLDKGHLGELGTSHLIARQELRALLKALNLPDFARTQPKMEPA